MSENIQSELSSSVNKNIQETENNTKFSRIPIYWTKEYNSLATFKYSMSPYISWNSN